MSMSDTLADMLTRIRNAQRSRLMYANTFFSRKKEAILNVLVEEGFIHSYLIKEVRNGVKEIIIKLKYSLKGEPNIKEINKVSAPGRRVYLPIKKLRPYYNNMGIYVISTSKGIISDRIARKLGVGGEVICKIF
ncbi:ribosomal S8 family protein [Orientia chuto str. Dubai]|uniref:Small ribosomal subunit protein uS8 n=1 Tax=Orientia chuto str. Dubai TaxID=1359168 RepID=A0A0F3MIH2_9RICK|nr:30S ribosomal protein S8 [Candidatus Orientia mediorientalis]KJV55267.1 ribosomal S8 family protein [Orientia chuto str. Dubai]